MKQTFNSIAVVAMRHTLPFEVSSTNRTSTAGRYAPIIDEKTLARRKRKPKRKPQGTVEIWLAWKEPSAEELAELAKKRGGKESKELAEYELKEGQVRRPRATSSPRHRRVIAASLHRRRRVLS